MRSQAEEIETYVHTSKNASRLSLLVETCSQSKGDAPTTCLLHRERSWIRGFTQEGLKLHSYPKIEVAGRKEREGNVIDE